MRRFFDPDAYYIVLFDQRGCGRSKPYASVENNTTWHLVSDMEAIRKKLGISKLVLFGGSWGAALSLIYAQTHPEMVSKIILRGVFTMTESELDWFYKEGGASMFWPEAWRAFRDMLPLKEQKNIIKGYHSRLFGSSPTEQGRFARAWTAWENALANLESPGFGSSPSTDYARAFARIENHYFKNLGFLSKSQQIRDNMHKILDIPSIIVQGRYDMICPPGTAELIHRLWPNSNLVMVSKAGHAMSEPAITAALVKATEQFKN
jgi:proline iminopeptidase